MSKRTQKPPQRLREGRGVRSPGEASEATRKRWREKIVRAKHNHEALQAAEAKRCANWKQEPPFDPATIAKDDLPDKWLSLYARWLQFFMTPKAHVPGNRQKQMADVRWTLEAIRSCSKALAKLAARVGIDPIPLHELSDSLNTVGAGGFEGPNDAEWNRARCAAKAAKDAIENREESAPNSRAAKKEVRRKERLVQIRTEFAAIVINEPKEDWMHAKIEQIVQRLGRREKDVRDALRGYPGLEFSRARGARYSVPPAL